MKKIFFTETVLRDAHQSLVATRMSTNQMLPILDTMDDAGYFALEAWGGATFDACLRFLNEDPWERLRTIKKHVKKTKLQMLLRGQNLLGYKHYSDEIVEKFIKKSIENGIDIIRVFDALNDERNLKKSIESIKKYDGHCQVALSYTISPVHNNDYYVEKIRNFEKIGVDSICIKDMAGLLTPKNAYDLVKKIKEKSSILVNIHSHCTTSIAPITYLKAVEAGADIIDTAIGPFSGGTSQPTTESMNVILKELGYDSGLNDLKLDEISKHFENVKKEFEDKNLFNPKVMQTIPKILSYQVPGGMLSNMMSQLKEQNAQEKFDEVLKEIPKVRKDLGYPPLVTPMSQMVGTQALLNVISNQRYKMILNEIKDYARGFYGKPALNISKEILEILIPGEEVINYRPADKIKVTLVEVKEELEKILKREVNEEIALSYAIFPKVTLDFLKIKNDIQNNNIDPILINVTM